MGHAWRQTWSDIVDSVRGKSPRATEPGGAAIDTNRAIDDPLDKKDPPATRGRGSIWWRRLANPKIAVAGLIASIATIPWLLTPFHFGADLWAPAPPAPDVVATFDGGQITLGDVEAHLDLLVPAEMREHAQSSHTLLSVVEDLISDQLVIRWAADRKPESDEAFRHAVKHINEELRLDAFANELHEDALPIAESEIRAFYDANRSRFGERSFADAREEIRQLLVAEREPAYVDDYMARLRANASITRSFDLLDIPPPTEEELKRYYRANESDFALQRRAVVDEIELPFYDTEVSARQQASDVLLRIRGGATFEEAAAHLPEARVSIGAEVADGIRPPPWDSNVFTMTSGQLGSVFQAGEAFFIVRLNELQPARIQSLSEVRPVVEAAVARENEREWFEVHGSKTLFTLDGKGYSLAQFYQEFQEMPVELRERYSGPKGLRELADSLIDRMLLVTDTYDNLLDVKSKPLADETRLQLLRQMMEQEEVDDKIEITDEEMQAFYAKNREQLIEPPKVRIRYIRIDLGTSADEERRARERAKEAYGKLVPGLLREGADFAVVAREYSEDAQTAANGGELPDWIGESGDPFVEMTDHPFHEAVLRLDPGTIGAPFELAGSLFIVEVLERTEPRTLSLEDVRPSIERALTSQEHAKLAASLQERLLEDADVEIYISVLEAYVEELSRSSASSAEGGDG
ncbi:MAG: peptidyl-prolyl cis-trans isomerase [Alphaproteobacteria bacterium]